MYTVDPVEIMRGVEDVVSHSVWYSKSTVVDILSVVMTSVMLATKVSMMNCEGPGMVVVKLMLETVVAVEVTRLVCQTSYCRMHSWVSLAKVRQTLRSTSAGGPALVSSCHGAR